jgi:hypothetical protein
MTMVPGRDLGTKNYVELPNHILDWGRGKERLEGHSTLPSDKSESSL